MTAMLMLIFPFQIDGASVVFVGKVGGMEEVMLRGGILMVLLVLTMMTLSVLLVCLALWCR